MLFVLTEASGFASERLVREHLTCERIARGRVHSSNIPQHIPHDAGNKKQVSQNND